MDRELQYVAFQLGKEYYGLDIMIIQEIILTPETIQMPDSQYFIKGVANIRGEIIPIIDLKLRFNLSDYSEASEQERRVIVIRLMDEKVGLLVDHVDEVYNFHESDIRQSGATTTDSQKEYINGIVDINERLMILLDISHALML